MLTLVFTITGCIGVKGAPTLIVDDYNGIDLDKIDHYKMEVEFDPIDKSYSADQKVIYVNNTENELKEVYFLMHLF